MKPKGSAEYMEIYNLSSCELVVPSRMNRDLGESQDSKGGTLYVMPNSGDWVLAES